MSHALDSAASRLVVAVLTVLFFRGMLHPGAPPARLPPAEVRQQSAERALQPAVARPTSAPTPADPMEAIWNDVLRTYGPRLRAAAATGDESDLRLVWAPIGDYLRTRQVSSAMLREWMVRRGWPPEAQQRVLKAAGYLSP